jgi:hypothetical protein
MEHSQEISKLATALVLVQAALKPVVKNSENPFFHSKYADLVAVSESCRMLLAEQGLAVVQTPTGGDGHTISISTMLLHSSGEWIRDTALYPLAKSDPQGVGSAITYARRYGLCAIVGIVTDDDDDGNGASDTPKPPAPGKPPVAPPAPNTPLVTTDMILKLMREAQTVAALTQTVRKYKAVPMTVGDKEKLNEEYKALKNKLNGVK